MNNEIVIFDYEENQVRVLEDINTKEPLFCLSDVCKVLEIKNITDVKNAINKEFDKGIDQILPLETNGGIQKMLMITEPQLYFVLMRSDKPKTKPFRQWVVNTVLPSIRKNGGYIAGQENMSELELLAKANLVSSRIIEEQKKKISEQEELIKIQNEKLKDKIETIEAYDMCSKTRRSKAELKAVFNKLVRAYAIQCQMPFEKVYMEVYKEFKKQHAFSYKKVINMAFIVSNSDYLTECIEIIAHMKNEIDNPPCDY